MVVEEAHSQAALSATPSSFPLRIALGLFQVVLLRRFRHPTHLLMWPPISTVSAIIVQRARRRFCRGGMQWLELP